MAHAVAKAKKDMAKVVIGAAEDQADAINATHLMSQLLLRPLRPSLIPKGRLEEEKRALQKCNFYINTSSPSPNL